MTTVLPVAVPLLPHCVCGHIELAHDLAERRGGKVRTWCTVWDENGKCPCVDYQSAAEGDGTAGSGHG